jgi:hypothetical protein
MLDAGSSFQVEGKKRRTVQQLGRDAASKGESESESERGTHARGHPPRP